MQALLLLPLIGAAMTGCHDDKTYDAPALPVEFKVSDTHMAFLKTAHTKQLYIESSIAPSVVSDAQWAHVGSVALNGQSTKTYAVDITVDENTTYDLRTATLTVTAGSNNATVAISQTNSEGILLGTVSKTDEFPTEGGTLTISLQATGAYTVATPSWVEQQESRALSSSTLTFSVKKNLGGSRSSEIVFTLDADESLSVSVPVSQARYVGETGESAAEAVKNMVVGWNLGNTMEAIGGETAWGNPMTTQALIDAVKAAGWNAVRIPTAWNDHSTDGVINADWMARVREIIDYCINDDMYVIVNIHWDGGWMEQQCNAESQEAVNAQVADYWTQIANALMDYDYHLLFAGANEPRNGDNWGKPSAAEQGALDCYMQTFVDAVRATGGNNQYRNLIIPSWCANGWRGLDSTTMPTDQVEGHLIYEMHFYDPQSMTHNGTTTKWGYRAGYVDTNDGMQEDYVDDFFASIKSHFVDNGYPVVIGEYGTECWSTSEEDVMESQAYYLEYVTRAAIQNGMAPFYWDNGTPGIGSFGIMNRTACAVGMPHFANAIMRGAYE